MYKEEKKKLKNGFDVLAPDLFDKICEQEASFVPSEKALFGELEEKDQRTHSRFVISAVFGSVLAVAACFFVFFHLMTGGTRELENQIIIDVNPSIQILLDEKNNVIKVEASNKDAEKILSKIEKTESVRVLMVALIQELQNQKYLTQDSTEILITYVYQEEKQIPKQLVTEAINQYSKEQKLALTVVQQHVKPDSKLAREAEKFGISVGKYYFLDKMEENYSVDKSKYYDKNINEIITEAEEKGYTSHDSQEIIHYGLSENNTDEDNSQESSVDNNIMKDGTVETEKNKMVSDKKQKEGNTQKKQNVSKKKLPSGKKVKENTKKMVDKDKEKENEKEKEKDKKKIKTVKKPTKNKKENKKENPKKENTKPDNDKKVWKKEEKTPSETKLPDESVTKDNEKSGKGKALQDDRPGKENQSKEEE